MTYSLPLMPGLLPAPIACDRWFAPAWLVVILTALLAMWSLRNGVTEGSIVRMSIASLLIWLTLAMRLEWEGAFVLLRHSRPASFSTAEARKTSAPEGEP